MQQDRWKFVAVALVAVVGVGASALAKSSYSGKAGMTPRSKSGAPTRSQGERTGSPRSDLRLGKLQPSGTHRRQQRLQH